MARSRTRHLFASLSAFALTICCWGIPRATAVVDLTDPWLIYVNGSPTAFLAHFEQTGTDLVITHPVPPYEGTIDPNTGVFHVEQSDPPPGLCAASIDGTATPDGLAFTATVTVVPFECTSTNPTSCACQPPSSYPISGERCPGCTACGDGVLDAPEECDDGNQVGGDCCSPTCTFEAAGGSCLTDNNVCTDDVCDGAGSCAHVPNTGPCPGTTCLPRSCSGGLCLGTFAPAGTPCVDDLLDCTADTCDGAGHCNAQPHDDCQLAGRRASILLDRSDDQRRILRWTWTDRSGVPAAADLGNPTSSTNYQMCIFDGSNVLQAFSAPAAADCDGKPCWRTSRHGFTYRDRAAAPNGLRAVRVRATAGQSAKMSVRGKGPNLPLTSSLALPSLRVQLVATDGSGTRCWESNFDEPTTNTDTRFKARR